ncbi:MAG: ABC transporter substrate-binding protein [Dehalococcoidia bacterium]|nr:ABC transporter substrate-binding protein [Dehalococcoidia bacterium]
MRKLTALFVLLLLAAACTPATAPTPTPTKAATSAAVTATKPPAEPTKPGAVAATPTLKPAVKPLDPPVTLKLGGTGSVSEGMLYMADAKGYFLEEGLKVEFVRFRSATEMVAPLGTGELDAGGGSPGPGLFNAIARDIPLKIVADRSTARPGQSSTALMVRKDLIDSGQVKGYSDIKGKTFAIVSKGAAGEIDLDKVLELGKVRVEDVNVVYLPFPDMIVAFANKAIDMAISIDPYNAQAAVQGVAVRWKGEDEFYPNHETSVLLYGANFHKTKPEAAKRFMVAYLRGIRDYVSAFTKNINRNEIISLLAKTTDVKDPALYDKMAITGVDPNGYPNPQSIGADQDWYFSKGLMPQKVDLSKVIDNQYVDYALERLGKYQP